MSRLQEIEKRLLEIRAEIDTDAADIPALEEEVDALQEERKGILSAAEKRKALIDKVTDGIEGAVVRTFEERGKATEKVYGADSPEYRKAFLNNLIGNELPAEQRAAFTHTTANTGAVLPTTMLNQIWDNISKKHSIMGDITVYRTGTILEVVKHTAIAAGKAKKVNENVANDDEQNTMVKVTLSGNDFSKHVIISYAMAAMSIDALEAYLIAEISDQLGEALADDVIATIKSGIAVANKMTTAAVGVGSYPELAKAFGTLKRTSNVCVYVNNATLYNQLVSMADTTGRPLFQPNMQNGAMGMLIGGTVKVEDSLSDGEILIGDPARVVYNMVQDVMIESQRDVKNHTIVHSGYARGSGALLDDQSFALVTLKTA